MENKTTLEEFFGKFVKEVERIIRDQLFINDCDPYNTPIECENDKLNETDSYYVQKNGKRILLCIVHALKFGYKGDDYEKNMVTWYQDVQIPKRGESGHQENGAPDLSTGTYIESLDQAVLLRHKDASLN